MRNKLIMVRRMMVRTFFADSFNRDVVLLLIFSAALGATLAGVAAMSADAYFSETISSLVGDYGEFDFLINIREETKADGRAQLEKIIIQVFPGAKLKEGPTLSGLTSFLVGLPEEFKNKQTYENIGTTFGSVPGRSGISIMTEPRLTVKGVPEGARSSVIEQIMQIDGVQFAFRDGGSVTAILKSLEQANAVNAEVEALLRQYKVIDIAFPVGSEPENPVHLGAQIADAIRADAGYAESVSVDSNNQDRAYLANTMLELKRFLNAYATKVTIRPASGIVLATGQLLIFQGAAPNAPVPGDTLKAEHVLVELTAITDNGVAEGRIIQGSAVQLAANPQAYLAADKEIGASAGTAEENNPRQRLGDALNETSKLAVQIPELSRDAQRMAGIAGTALSNYNSSLETVERTLNSLDNASRTIQAATSGLANLDTTAIQTQLGNSSRALGGLLTTLQVVRILSPDVENSIAELTQTRQSIERLQAGMSALDQVAADGKQARDAIDSIVVNGNSTVRSLRSFDVNGARQTLAAAGGRLGQFEQFNAAAVAEQLQYLGASVPLLQDAEISSSIKLLDQFIAGQVIPSQRIQILTSSAVTTEFAAPVIYREAGHTNLSLYTSDMGIIEPDPRAEVMIILRQVKSILAGLISIIAVILFLVLDHAAIMSIIRRNRMVRQTLQPRRKLRLIQGIRNVFTARECLYGMLAGALLMTAMFVLSGGGIPYLPWLGVPVIGALLGLLVANNAEKISPVAVDEVTAGEALGLSFDEIMREIVIPSSRPGLLQKLNQRKMKFK